MEKELSITKEEAQVLLDALEDLLYKLAMDMDNLKGGPMTADRQKLDSKQKLVEELQHKISLLR